jgi:hypothetical protein
MKILFFLFFLSLAINAQENENRVDVTNFLINENPQELISRLEQLKQSALKQEGAFRENDLVLLKNNDGTRVLGNIVKINDNDRAVVKWKVELNNDSTELTNEFALLDLIKIDAIEENTPPEENDFVMMKRSNGLKTLMNLSIVNTETSLGIPTYISASEMAFKGYPNTLIKNLNKVKLSPIGKEIFELENFLIINQSFHSLNKKLNELKETKNKFNKVVNPSISDTLGFFHLNQFKHATVKKILIEGIIQLDLNPVSSAKPLHLINLEVKDLFLPDAFPLESTLEEKSVNEIDQKIKNILLNLNTLQLAFERTAQHFNRTTNQQKACEDISFDNRNNMAPDIDQKRSPFCWAQTVGSLLDEQLCLMSIRYPEENGGKNYCNTHVSRSEIAAYGSRGKNLLAQPSGGHVRDALLAYITPLSAGGRDGKVCLQKYGQNPFDKNGEQRITELKFYFRKNKHAQAASVCQEDLQLQHKVQDDLMVNKSDWTVMPPRLQQQEQEQANEPEQQEGLNLSEILGLSENEDDFTRNVLLHFCKESTLKRFSPADSLKVESFNYKPDPQIFTGNVGNELPENRKNFINQILKAKTQGHSLGVTFCYHPMVNELKLKAGSKPSELSANSDKCGSHAVVLNAVKWDKETASCQVHIKNSHGPNATLKSGFYSLKTLSKYIFRTDFLSKK